MVVGMESARACRDGESNLSAIAECEFGTWAFGFVTRAWQARPVTFGPGRPKLPLGVHPQDTARVASPSQPTRGFPWRPAGLVPRNGRNLAPRSVRRLYEIKDSFLLTGCMLSWPAAMGVFWSPPGYVGVAEQAEVREVAGGGCCSRWHARACPGPSTTRNHLLGQG